MANKLSKIDNKAISERVNSLIAKNALSKYRLADLIKTSQANLSNWINNKTEWNLNALALLADHFRVSLDYLITGKELDDRVQQQKSTTYREIKIYERIAAGSATEIFDNPLDIINLPHPFINNLKGEIAGFYVKGDSMRPRITEGDIVITKMLDLPNEKPRNKDMIVTVFHKHSSGSEGNLKLFTWTDKDKGSFVLSSINPYISPSIHNMNDVRYMFRVYLVISKVDYK